MEYDVLYSLSVMDESAMEKGTTGVQAGLQMATTSMAAISRHHGNLLLASLSAVLTNTPKSGLDVKFVYTIQCNHGII